MPGSRWQASRTRSSQSHSPAIRRWRIAAAAAGWVAFLLALNPTLAAAHALVLESSPPPDAVLAHAPEQILLRFNSRIEHRLTRLTLTDTQGRAIPLSPLAPADAAPDRLVIPLPPLAPGTYVLRYRVLAVDGHLTEGLLRFTVREPG